MKISDQRLFLCNYLENDSYGTSLKIVNPRPVLAPPAQSRNPLRLLFDSQPLWRYEVYHKIHIIRVGHILKAVLSV